MSGAEDKRRPLDKEDAPALQVERHLSYREYARHVSTAVWVADVPWHLYGRVLMPLTMPHIPLIVDRSHLRKVMSKCGALLACWTTDWDCAGATEWWWVACDQDNYGVETLPSSSGRRSIRKGLRECEVRLLDVEEFCDFAYPIYRAAIESYGAQSPDREAFARNVHGLACYEGTDFWAAFCENQMAAFTVCQIRDGAVDLSMAKSDPRFHRHEPNAALFYGLTRHYLSGGIEYVTNGARTLSHPTTINDFLEKLGFRKVYCRVEVELSLTASLVNRSRIARWGRNIGLPGVFPRHWEQVESFDKLMRIADTFK